MPKFLQNTLHDAHVVTRNRHRVRLYFASITRIKPHLYKQNGQWRADVRCWPNEFLDTARMLRLRWWLMRMNGTSVWDDLLCGEPFDRAGRVPATMTEMQRAAESRARWRESDGFAKPYHEWST